MSSTSAAVGARRSFAALRLLLVLTLVIGLFYPLVFTGLAQLVGGNRADGSYVENADGDVVGSSLIGQLFDGDEWFQPRPSAAGEGYDPLATAASNLGPESEDLVALIDERKALLVEQGIDEDDIPVDALTASGSGLDPHISPAYARLQIDRVAEARGLDSEVVADAVEARVEGRQLGFIGAERVNVLLLNLELERLED